MNGKSFLDEIKSMFYSFLRLSFGEKMEIAHTSFKMVKKFRVDFMKRIL